MNKPRTRLCARCRRQQRTGNAYCRECDAIRKAEARGKVQKPETEEGQGARDLVDKTFDLLEAGGEGTEITVNGISMKSEENGQVTFKLNNRQQRRLAEKVKRLQKGA